MLALAHKPQDSPSIFTSGCKVPVDNVCLMV